MNELNNVVTSTGTYNNIPTSLTSNTSVVNMIDGLTITKTADKQNWGSGNLTYTIVLDNQTATSYVNPSIVDVIDNNLVDFVTGSVTINGASASESEYSYNNDTHTLTVTPGDLTANSKVTITFSVKKKT